MNPMRMSDENKTTIGTNSKLSIAMIALIAGPSVLLVSMMYELRSEIVALKSDMNYVHVNTWTISDMERYRFAVQLQNPSMRIPEVREIVNQRPK